MDPRREARANALIQAVNLAVSGAFGRPITAEDLVSTAKEFLAFLTAGNAAPAGDSDKDVPAETPTN